MGIGFQSASLSDLARLALRSTSFSQRLHLFISIASYHTSAALLSSTQSGHLLASVLRPAWSEPLATPLNTKHVCPSSPMDVPARFTVAWPTTRRQRSDCIAISFLITGDLVAIVLLMKLLLSSDRHLSVRPSGVAANKALAISKPDSTSLLNWDLDAYNNGTLGMRPDQSHFTTTVRSALFQVITWKPRSAEGAPYFFMTLGIEDQPGGVHVLTQGSIAGIHHVRQR